MSMKENTVYVIQEIAGTREGKPRINIMGASEYGSLKFLLPELSQIIFSPGPLIFKLFNCINQINNILIQAQGGSYGLRSRIYHNGRYWHVDRHC